MIGLDPEVLVLDGEDRVVAASHFLGGPGDGEPPPISFDNAAVEMRPYPFRSSQRLTEETGRLFRHAISKTNLAAHWDLIPKGARISLTPCAPLRDIDRAEKSVNTFGCSPASIVTVNHKPLQVKPFVSAEKTALRSAGFHIHRQLDPRLNTSAMVTISVLDGLLGLLDVLVNQKGGYTDAARKRRRILGYGRAGEHRFRRTEAGEAILEYRTLSPWPLAAPQGVRYVTSVMNSVCSVPFDQLIVVLDSFPPRGSIMSAINDSDYKTALRLWAQCMNAWQKEVGQNAARKWRLQVHLGLNPGSRKWISGVLQTGDNLKPQTANWRYIRAS